MSWYDEPDHSFAGIAEKLKRADQNIINLNSEIEAFIQCGKYPVIPHPNAEGWQEAVAYHRSKPIPLRFAVLVGETVHHLRSCLDHIVWHFSDSESRKKPGSIEFPILEFEPEPLGKKELERYARKVKGITNTNVLSIIKDMQPYKAGADVENHALLIIHNMDRFDKHQELLIVDSGVQVAFPPAAVELRRKAALYTQGKLPESEHIEIAHAFQDNLATPGISFREFGQHRPYAVINGLRELWIHVMNAVTSFADEI